MKRRVRFTETPSFPNGKDRLGDRPRPSSGAGAEARDNTRILGSFTRRSSDYSSSALLNRSRGRLRHPYRRSRLSTSWSGDRAAIDGNWA